jgi:DivIVA domain-containing protein
MEFSPQTIRDTAFTTVKKGYDPDEVDAFKDHVAEAIEAAQTHAAQMESRARAAVGRLQEATQQVAVLREGTPSGGIVQPSIEEAETISRTLVLAQRTADSTVAEARGQAEQITTSARDEASSVLEKARATAAKLVDDAKVDARKSKEDELARAENEVQALLARRDFLLGDVDQLEHYVQAQRERLREAALTLTDLAERVPGGLGDLRRPVLSASAEPVAHDDETRQVPTIAPTAPAQPAPAPAPAPTPAAVVAPAPAATPEPITRPQPLVVKALDVDDEDDDPMSLFSSAPPQRSSGQQAARAPFDFADDEGDDDPLWDGFDEGAAATQVVPQVFDEVTAEVPVIKPAKVNDPFRIGGDELH